MISPEAMLDSREAFSAPWPQPAIARVAIIAAVNGSGISTAAVPLARIACSATDSPSPPQASGTTSPVQPRSAIACHAARSNPGSVSRSARALRSGSDRRQ